MYGILCALHVWWCGKCQWKRVYLLVICILIIIIIIKHTYAWWWQMKKCRRAEINGSKCRVRFMRVDMNRFLFLLFNVEQNIATILSGWVCVCDVYCTCTILVSNDHVYNEHTRIRLRGQLSLLLLTYNIRLYNIESRLLYIFYIQTCQDGKFDFIKQKKNPFCQNIVSLKTEKLGSLPDVLRLIQKALPC